MPRWTERVLDAVTLTMILEGRNEGYQITRQTASLQAVSTADVFDVKSYNVGFRKHYCDEHTEGMKWVQHVARQRRGEGAYNDTFNRKPWKEETICDVRALV